MRIFIFCLPLIWFSCTNTSSDPLLQNLEEAIDYEVAEDVTIWYSDSAKIKARIEGKVLRRFIDRVKPFDEFSEGVVVDFFDSDGEVESKMEADYAIRYDKDELIVARDPKGVVLSNIDGDTMISSEIIWDSGEDRIYTQRFVKIITPSRIIWGQGFESNNDFSKGRIKSVEGQIEVDDIVEEDE